MRPPAPAPTLRHFATAAEAAPVIAAEGIGVLRRAIATHGTASLALTGGSAPGAIYEQWATTYRDAIDWRQVHFFWGDERNVPHGHDDSNVRTSAVLFDKLNTDATKVHPWACDQSPENALENMRQVLAKAGITARGFDLCLLGVGPDGHVASLFPPHTPWRALADDDHADAVAFVTDSPKPPAERYTFTLPFINRSAVIYLLPFGESKREALKGFLHHDDSMTVRYVHAREQTVVWTDQDVSG